jgi:hypothetical protein
MFGIFVALREHNARFGVILQVSPFEGESRLTPSTLCSHFSLRYCPHRRVVSDGRRLGYVAPGEGLRPSDKNGYDIPTWPLLLPRIWCILTPVRV